jgi:hypothetical protein
MGKLLEQNWQMLMDPLFYVMYITSVYTINIIEKVIHVFVLRVKKILYRIDMGGSKLRPSIFNMDPP